MIPIPSLKTLGSHSFWSYALTVSVKSRNLNHNFDLLTPDHITSRISHNNSYTKFKHFEVIHFGVMLQLLV